jgi:hypothetical protein
MERIRDLKLGNIGETTVFQLLKERYGNVTRSNNRFCPYDFESNNIRFELKTRSIKHDAYTTAPINDSKIARTLVDCCDVLMFLFQYTDGLYYITYDKELFKGFKRGEIRRERDGKMCNSGKLIYIPHGHLTKW